MSLSTIKKNRYLQALYSYGFITLCYMINHYERLENYEECQIILDAMNEHNQTLGEDMPTRFDAEAKEYFLEAIQGFGLSGDKIIKNLPTYARRTRELVNHEILQWRK